MFATEGERREIRDASQSCADLIPQNMRQRKWRFSLMDLNQHQRAGDRKCPGLQERQGHGLY